MPLDVWLTRPPLKDDPAKHAWTCPKYMPLILKGPCNCSAGASRDSLAPLQGQTETPENSDQPEETE